MNKLILILSLIIPAIASANTITESRVLTPTDKALSIVGHINDLNQVLYVFDIDKNTNKGSACNNACAEKWPPILLTKQEADKLPKENGLGSIIRDSSLIQLTINDRPVYTFYKDKSVLEANGHGLGGVWHISQPIKDEI